MTCRGARNKQPMGGRDNDKSREKQGVVRMRPKREEWKGPLN